MLVGASLAGVCLAGGGVCGVPGGSRRAAFVGEGGQLVTERGEVAQVVAEKVVGAADAAVAAAAGRWGSCDACQVGGGTGGPLTVFPAASMRDSRRWDASSTPGAGSR